ncbi:MAG: M23 family metallopeptidase [Actinomycetota bacterium]|nr:M23 family metallopeptidase [Actinomycetota bacterium]MDQ2958940.1 M23 family metallopeptidase [Actinomycetota bacterium]
MRILLSISAMLALTVAGSGAPVGAAAVAPVAAGRVLQASYRAPVLGTIRVLRPFQPPLHKYGPGHLGVDLAVGAGGQVVAAGAGLVRFAGRVAGRGVLVIAHPDGLSTEYEPVTGSVPVGARVERGQPIGRVSGSHSGCPASCLHWGARRGEDYLDPMSLLDPLGVVRLLPWDYPRPAGYLSAQAGAGRVPTLVWTVARMPTPARGESWPVLVRLAGGLGPCLSGLAGGPSLSGPQVNLVGVCQARGWAWLKLVRSRSTETWV